MKKINKIKIKKSNKSISQNFPDFSISDLTVITGENNSGKTNFIEAINSKDKNGNFTKTSFVDDENQEITDVDVIYIPASYIKGDEELKIGKTSRVGEIIKSSIKGEPYFSFNYDTDNNADSFNELMSSVNRKMNEIVSDDLTNESVMVGIGDLPFEKVFSEALTINPIDRLTSENHRNFDDMGQGWQRLIIVSFILADAERSDDNRLKLILLEEPEICLHPKLKKKLNVILNEIANKPNYQVIITTHDPYFAYSNLGNLDSEEENKKIVYSFERKPDKLTYFSNPNEISGVSDELLHLMLFDRFYTSKGEDIKEREGKNNMQKDGKLNAYLKEYSGEAVNDYFFDKEEEKNPHDLALPLYIRHCLNHPDNKYTKDRSDEKNKYNEDDLEKSIEILNKILSN